MAMLLALTLTAVATAQEDNPWDTEFEDDASAPATAPASIPTPVADLDRAGATGPGFGTSGFRIAPIRAGTGVSVAQGSVVGGNGGTNVWTTAARIRVDEEWSLVVSLPFASFRTVEGRDAGLGNVGLELWYDVPVDGDVLHSVGVESHFTTGGSAYTWVNRPEQLWPGSGANFAYQGLFEADDTLSVIFRGSLGVHAAEGFAPYPDLFLRANAAGGVDYAVVDQVGVIAETSLSWWDVSPWELTGLVRVDPVDGLRLRGGLVLPFLNWAGAQPADPPGGAGAREATLLLDVAMAL